MLSRECYCCSLLLKARIRRHAREPRSCPTRKILASGNRTVQIYYVYNSSTLLGCEDDWEGMGYFCSSGGTLGNYAHIGTVSSTSGRLAGMHYRHMYNSCQHSMTQYYRRTYTSSQFQLQNTTKFNEVTLKSVYTSHQCKRAIEQTIEAKHCYKCTLANLIKKSPRRYYNLCNSLNVPKAPASNCKVSQMSSCILKKIKKCTMQHRNSSTTDINI